MKKINFSQNWYVRQLDSNQAYQEVTVPHDAMIYENRSSESMGGHNIGYFEANDYEYKKTFYVPLEDKDKHYVLEFEGVFHQAVIYLNGKKVMFRPYGYTDFFVDLDSYLNFGKDNTIEVVVQNHLQPNSRWYTGTGIYRPVHLYIGENEYVKENGIKIKTLSIDLPTIEVSVLAKGSTKALVEIFDGKNRLSEASVQLSDDNGVLSGKVAIELPTAKLWSQQSPKLYHAKVTVGHDQVDEIFGIRTIDWNVDQGLLINGQREILRGACIHHDNGMLGACSFPEAEERKVKKLKEAGYNAIRSAHNPCSKALLSACDRLGMLVLDEYTDGWYIHKTKYDYALYIDEWWQNDLIDMINKDYNHPSVIMYSTGNEVSETAQPRGIQFTKEMQEFIHQLDETRPVTVGVNIFFNFLSSVGFGVYSDEKSLQEVENKKNKKKAPVGSEFYNTLAGMLGSHTMKIGATLYPCDLKTKDAYENMDIAGYNYGILRYKNDLKKYPNRLILGTETFCSDAYTFWEIAKENPRILGDFVWAGMDYMGEAGIGSWVYPEYAPVDAPKEGWLTAGSGRLDLLGQAHGEAAYTKVAFEQVKGPLMAVRPVHMEGNHSPSAWKMTDALLSWSYPGCEGKKAEVEVYTRDEVVRLFINQRQVGVKRAKNGRAIFNLPYEPGTLTAKTFDRSGNLLGEVSLKTASEKTIISLFPEGSAVHGQLMYVPIEYTDEVGNIKPMERGRIHLEVTGGELVALGHACPYNPDGFHQTDTDTYYGQAMAIIRVGTEEELSIIADDGQYHTKLTLLTEEGIDEYKELL